MTVTPAAAPTLPASHLTVDPDCAVLDGGPQLGVRMALASRAAQGFSLTPTDPAILDELAAMCALPRWVNPATRTRHDC